jgi:hypothetical protein
MEIVTESSKEDIWLDINGTNLDPYGSTSIAAGMARGFDQLDESTADTQAVIVLTDGKENTPYSEGGSSYTVTSLPRPDGVKVYAVGLGRESNIDKEKLSLIAESTGGVFEATGILEGVDYFKLEKYFIQTAMGLIGDQLVLDPVTEVAMGETVATDIYVLPQDRSLTVVVLDKEGGLPFAIQSPEGELFPTNSPPPGFLQSYSAQQGFRILRLKMPLGESERYGGWWKVSVTNAGYVMDVGEKPRPVRTPQVYGLAAGVRSSFRLAPFLSMGRVTAGEPIIVSAMLSENGIPVAGGVIEVEVSLPDGSASTMDLLDDGSHQDGDADDGTYANSFPQTGVTGAYSFWYHAFARTAREEPVTREASLGKYVFSEPSAELGRPDVAGRCCWQLRLLLLVIAILLALLVLGSVGRWIYLWRAGRQSPR